MVATIELLPYPVNIAEGALGSVGDIVCDLASNHRVAVITDENVGALYAQGVLQQINRRRNRDDTVLLSIPSGEDLKTRETWARLTDALFENQLGRDTTIVALGGGVVGDLAGFVAATYMRGVPVVQVPTTLLAMVDASVGGKTGVDTKFGKNLVGAFHRPAAVIIDPQVLQTLPDQALRAGMAEVIKHGIVADAHYFERVAAFAETLSWTPKRWSEFVPIIRRSVEVKAGIVARDERESGLRKVLNFGHTIAHALELLNSYAISHGDAVGMGLVIEARIAERIGVADRGTAEIIQRVVSKMGLPTIVTARMHAGAADKIVELTYADKKARGGQVEYALPSRIGEMAGADRGYGIPVDDQVVREVLRS